LAETAGVYCSSHVLYLAAPVCQLHHHILRLDYTSLNVSSWNEPGGNLMRENCPHHLLFAPNVLSSSTDNQINVRAPVREKKKLNNHWTIKDTLWRGTNYRQTNKTREIAEGEKNQNKKKQKGKWIKRISYVHV
jgi:hypothetical protein